MGRSPTTLPAVNTAPHQACVPPAAVVDHIQQVQQPAPIPVRPTRAPQRAVTERGPRLPTRTLRVRSRVQPDRRSSLLHRSPSKARLIFPLLPVAGPAALFYQAIPR